MRVTGGGGLAVNSDHVMTISIPDDWVDLLLLWLDWLRATDLAEGTIKLRSYQLRRFARFLADEFPQIAPDGVTIDMLTSYLAAPSWSSSTKRSARSALKSFYGWLRLSERISSDPTRHLRRIAARTGSPRPAGEIAVKFASKDSDPRVRLMVKLGSQLGLRCVEISQVHTDDVYQDLVGYSIRVHGKGRKIRVIPIGDELAREILLRDRGYLFPGRVDGHLSAPYVSKLLSRALPEGVTGHMLRHRFAGVAYEGTGYDLRATQELLGHASVATTQIYTPARTDQMRRGILAAAG